MILFNEDECNILDCIHQNIEYYSFAKLEKVIDNKNVMCYIVNRDWLRQFCRAKEIGYPLFLDKSSNMYVYIPIDYTSKKRATEKLLKQKQEIEMTKPLSINTTSTKKNPTENVPIKNTTYVPFGVHDKLTRILATGNFMPVYINGLSGCGKTETIKQVCHDLGRECFVMNINKETDESDMIGHYTLKNGDTVWQDGPALIAMERGGVLLLDEVDLAGPKLMCLQSILNGDGYYIKKQNRYVKAAAGFTVIATANTKGRGDATGSFIGANVQNEAALDRYRFMYIQTYPDQKIEAQILTNNFVKLSGIKEKDMEQCDKNYITELVNLAYYSREAYKQEKVDSVITTRRLIGAVEYYVLTDRNVEESIEVIFERFTGDTITFLNELKEKNWTPIFEERDEEDEDIYESESAEAFDDGFDPSEYSTIV